MMLSNLIAQPLPLYAFYVGNVVTFAPISAADIRKTLKIALKLSAIETVFYADAKGMVLIIKVIAIANGFFMLFISPVA